MAENTTNSATMDDLLEEFKNAQHADRQNIIIQAAKLQDHAEKKEERDEELKKLLDDGIKKQLGETGFRGIIKASTEGFTKLLTSQKSMGDLFGDLKSSFSTDVSFITGALSPLTAIPGISTAIGIMKFALGLLWKGIQKFWAWQKARRQADEKRARLAGLSKEGAESATNITTEKKNWFLGFIGKLWAIAKHLILFIGAVIVGFLLAITKPFRVVTGMLWAPIWTGIKFLSSKVGGWLKNLGTRLFGPTSWLGKQINPKLAKVAMTPKQAIANYNKQLKAGTFGKSGVTGFGGRFSQAMSSARGWLSRIGTKMGPMLSKVGDFFKKLGGILKAIVTNKFVMGAAKFFSRLVAYVIAPIVAIVGMWKGWNATEGGPMAKAWGAFKGGINELWEFFIIDFADAIKDIISWIGKKLGFDMAWLDSWSFQELWDTFTDFLSNITEFIGNMLSDLWEGIKSWRPRFLRSNEPDMDPLAGTPATTPPNAFMDMFPANRPANGDNIENFNRMRVRDTGGTDTAAGRAMTAVQNNSTTNNMTNVSVLESVVPGDRWSAELATQYE